VPLSVVILAGAIETVATIPVRRRNRDVENYVLSQFGENLTVADFADIRRSVNLGDDDPVTANDFLLAMLLRLGQVSPNDWIKCRRLFSKLDRDGSGVLDEADIEALVLLPPATRNLDDDTFDVNEHLDAAEDIVRLENPMVADGGYEVE